MNGHYQNEKLQLSISARLIFVLIFLLISALFSFIQYQIPDSYKLLYGSILAVSVLAVALIEGTIIKKSPFNLVLFLILPLMFSSVSLMLWAFEIPYNKISLWMSFVHWDSLIIFNFFIFGYLLQKKVIK